VGTTHDSSKRLGLTLDKVRGAMMRTFTQNGYDEIGEKAARGDKEEWEEEKQTTTNL
jgi:hypothetical protein